MAVNILLKRSATPSKRPDPNAIYDGELTLNYDAATGGLYYKDTNDEIVKVGPCQISATAPNSSPAGSPGNSLGEFWFNPADSSLNVWNGTAWVETNVGSAVQNVTGVSPINVDNTDPTNPVVSIDAASTSTPGAVQLNDTVTSTSVTEAATANAVKTAYDKADAAIPDATFTASGELIVGTGAGTYTILAPGATDYILQSNGDGTLSWVENSVGDVTSVSGTAPIQVDNTDPQNPIVSADAATTSASGVVQLNDTVTSTSTAEAATANAVKVAYDLADAALPTAGGTMTGDITLFGAGVGIVFDDSSTVEAISDAISITSSVTAASSTAVKTAYDLANAALPKSGGTMTGDILFNAGQVFPGTVTSVTALGGSAISVDNTDPTQPIIGVASATTTNPGVVQLNDTVSSPSTTEALTANQGYLLQQQIDALVIANNLTFAGTFDTSTGFVDSVSSAGTLAGFVVGSPLPTPAVANTDYFVIVDVEGSTGPAGTPPYHIGDWFLSDGAAWQFLNVGFQAAYATTTSTGVVQLATDAEVQAGTDTDHVVVPSSLQSKMSDSTSTTSSTTIASSTAVKSAYDLANAAIPQSGGNLNGQLYFIVGSKIHFQGSGGELSDISDSTNITSSTTAASSAAVKAAYDLANVAMPKTGGNFTGSVTFDSGTNLTVDVGANFLMDGGASFSGSTNFEGTSVTNFLTGSAVTFESSLTIGTTGTTYTLPGADGSANYILATDGAGVVSWVAQSEGDVTGVTGTAPITVDNTDPQNPIVGIDSASITQPGAVQLNDTVTSTSTTEAATANAVKTAYDAAMAAAGSGLQTTGGTMTGNITFSAGTTVEYADTTSNSVIAADQLATVVDNATGSLTIIDAFDAGTF